MRSRRFWSQGAVLAGLIASQIFYADQTLTAFKVQIVGFIGVFIVAMLIPLTVFAPRLAQAKREGLRDYGRLASRYVREFEEMGSRRRVGENETMIGSADIQSLADLGNSYGVVQEMRLIPFGLKDVARLAVIAATPSLAVDADDLLPGGHRRLCDPRFLFMDVRGESVIVERSEAALSSSFVCLTAHQWSIWRSEPDANPCRSRSGSTSFVERAHTGSSRQCFESAILREPSLDSAGGFQAE